MTEQIKLSTLDNQKPSKPLVDEGTWMSLAEAASATGLSVITLRRYIQRKKLRGRRLGKTSNAKLQVYIDAEFVETHEETEGLEDILQTTEVETIDESEVEDGFERDQVDQATAETMHWLRERLDQSLEEIQKLNQQLQGAQFRNGYLESQMISYNEQIKLLTQSKELPAVAPEPVEIPQEKPAGWWQRFGSWFVGKQ